MRLDDFQLVGEHLEELEPIAGKKRVSDRTMRDRRRAAERLHVMHIAHGKGPEDRLCRGCVSLTRHGYRGFLKCARYRVSSSEATDWRAKWRSCGAYEEKKK